MTDAQKLTDRTPEHFEEPPQATRAPRGKANPWVVTLAVIWALLTVAGIVLISFGNGAANATFDNASGPRHDVLAGIYYVSGGIVFAVAFLTLVAQIAVAAVRWQPRDR
jgi:hypothetical protein